ncbi:hypothetical protein GCM10010336_50440 [Streptomyces goshikiensis]|nr:hypothetical protein GCM10010336_50440 [Streptomyces goshikiensis]
MKLVAGLVPNFTAVVPERFVPVMVTSVPPPVDPWFGEMGMERLLAVRTGTEDTADRRDARRRRHAWQSGAEVRRGFLRSRTPREGRGSGSIGLRGFAECSCTRPTEKPAGAATTTIPRIGMGGPPVCCSK